MYGVKTLVNAAGITLSAFIDFSPLTLMPSVSDVETALEDCGNTATLIVLLSHIGGIVNPEMDAIASLCRWSGAILIEDCAHSFGAILVARRET